MIQDEHLFPIFQALLEQIWCGSLGVNVAEKIAIDERPHPGITLLYALAGDASL